MAVQAPEIVRRPPDVEYVGQIRQAADRARNEQAGLSATCAGEDTPLVPASVALPTRAQIPVQVPLVTDCSGFATFEVANAYYAAHPLARPYIDPNFDRDESGGCQNADFEVEQS